MTKKEYIKAKAELDAIHGVMYTLKSLAEEELENLEESNHSERLKHFTQTKAELYQAAYDSCYNTFRRSRADMIRAIAEYEIEHPLETI